MFMLVVSALVVFAGSIALTGLFRRYAMSHRLLDIPNQRSSHVYPTPRGGGLAFVLAFSLSLGLVGIVGLADGLSVAALLGSGFMVAALGFADDRGHIAARWRLLGQGVAAGYSLYLIGGVPAVDVFGVTLELGVMSYIVAGLYLVWLVNLYNFMDGIDGIAGVEAICVCVGGVLLYWRTGNSEYAWMPLLLGTSVAGFLLWNWPPARIFMGDVGSGFLGIVLGVMSIQAGWVLPGLFWGWLILLGLFVVDATVTLLRRLLRREKVYEAHRMHAYQHASRRYGHRPVTIAAGVINLIWLLPLAMMAARGVIAGTIAVLIAYLPLACLAIWYRAGTPEKPE